MVVTPGREGTAAGQEGEEEGDEAEEEHSVARRPELVPGFGAVVQVFGNLPKQTNATQVLSTAGYQEPGAETGERDTHSHQEEVSAADSGPQHGVAAPRPAHPGLLSVTAHICHEPADQVVLTAESLALCAGVCRCVQVCAPVQPVLGPRRHPPGRLPAPDCRESNASDRVYNSSTGRPVQCTVYTLTQAWMPKIGWCDSFNTRILSPATRFPALEPKQHQKRCNGFFGSNECIHPPIQADHSFREEETSYICLCHYLQG